MKPAEVLAMFNEIAVCRRSDIDYELSVAEVGAMHAAVTKLVADNAKLRKRLQLRAKEKYIRDMTGQP